MSNNSYRSYRLLTVYIEYPASIIDTENTLPLSLCLSLFLSLSLSISRFLPLFLSLIFSLSCLSLFLSVSIAFSLSFPLSFSLYPLSRSLSLCLSSTITQAIVNKQFCTLDFGVRVLFGSLCATKFIYRMVKSICSQEGRPVIQWRALGSSRARSEPAAGGEWVLFLTLWGGNWHVIPVGGK